MVRSLWSAASGMKAQQTSVDVIANNIANVNTTGYRAQVAQFKTLLYQTLREEATTANGDPKPTSAQVGLGTRIASINSSFKTGAFLASENTNALAISGDGFFGITVGDQTMYTRAGDFNWSLTAGGQRILTTNDGYPVQDTAGAQIVLPNGVSADAVMYGDDGSIGYRGADGKQVLTGQKVGLWQFNNRTGLEKVSNTMFRETMASGAPIPEAGAGAGGLTPSAIVSGYLEGSNVNVADEMVNLIVAQRAYELNSKAITTSDSMLDTANQLKR